TTSCGAAWPLPCMRLASTFHYTTTHTRQQASSETEQTLDPQRSAAGDRVVSARCRSARRSAAAPPSQAEGAARATGQPPGRRRPGRAQGRAERAVARARPPGRALQQLGEREGAVRARRQQQVLAVGGDQELREAEVLVAQVVAALVLDAVHLQAQLLVVLRR